MPKFLIPTIYNNSETKYEDGSIKMSGLGSGLGLEFMQCQSLPAAQNAGYEIYHVLYSTVGRDENSAPKADLVKVELGNLALLDRLLASEENLRELIAVGDEALVRQKLDVQNDAEKITQEITELANIAERSEEQNLQLVNQQQVLAKNENLLADEKNWKHNIWSLTFCLIHMDKFVTTRQDAEFIEHLNQVAAREPKITWDPNTPFLRRERINGVDLKSFLEVGKAQNDNVFYIRDFKEGEKFDEVTNIFKELEDWGVKFPTSTRTLAFHEKVVVKENLELAKHSLPLEVLEDNDAEGLNQFYLNYGRQEGIVLKPYLTYGGNGILFLEPNISETDLPNRVAAILNQAKEIGKKLEGQTHAEGAIDFSKIIVQQKLNNLSNDGDLYAGDIRFTEINGELIGGALRYSDTAGDKALSYSKCRNLLPDNKLFNQENIAEFLKKAVEAGEARKSDYYQNLLEVFDVATDVTKWCKDNGHFHVGFDVLIGRNSNDKWSKCLTELNTGWPDCIPEHRWINTKCGAPARHVNICENVIDLVKNGQYISPLKVEKELESSAIKPVSGERVVKKMALEIE